MSDNMKYCKYCGERIHMDAVVCPHCGRQVEMLQSAKDDRQIIINNNNNINTVSSSSSSASASAYANAFGHVRRCNKWVAFLLCLFTLCGHKFYEGKYAQGWLYLFTLGLFGFGWLFDLIILFFKPNPYYVDLRR